jgi:HPt (histidine-containing phosphotransfer) domain-containing protein
MNTIYPPFQYINMQLIDEIMEDDNEALKQLIVEFIYCMESDLVHIQSAYTKKDMVQVGMIAHKFKSMFNYFGVNCIQAQLQELEMASRKKNQGLKSKQLMVELVQCTHHTLSEVRQLWEFRFPNHALNSPH